jgi:hypothetical protein
MADSMCETREAPGFKAGFRRSVFGLLGYQSSSPEFFVKGDLTETN